MSALARVIVQEPGGLKDRTPYLHSQSQFTWQLVRGQRGQANLSFRVPAGTFYDPKIGWPVFIYELFPSLNLSKCVFAGTIFDRDIFWKGKDGWNWKALQLVSLEEMFDNCPCPAIEFPDGTDAGTIFSTLFGYASGMPVAVTLGTVDAGMALPKRSYDARTSIGAAFGQLATDTAFIWYVGPDDLKVYFHANDTRPIGFDLVETMIRWESAHYKENKADFRNKQIVQMNPNVLPPSSAVFAGDSSTTGFNLPQWANQVVSAALTTSTQAMATGTFSGQPNPGDTITIGGQAYTAAAALDNTVANLFLIGATANDTAQNLCNAINLSGTGFSTPTQPNISARASGASAGAFTLTAIAMGIAGNAVAISESATNFVWSGVALSGGIDGTTTPLSVGLAGAGTFDLTYTPGSSDVTARVAPVLGQSLAISYAGPNAGLITVSNGADASEGLQTNYQIMTARNVTTVAGGTQQGTAALTDNDRLPATFSFDSDTPCWYPGRFVAADVASPVDADFYLNGEWLVHQVQGTWIPGAENLPEPWGHFRYHVDLINTNDIATVQDTLQRMADTGPLDNQQPVTQPTTGGGESVATLYSEKLFIKDVTVGLDIADHVRIYAPVISLSPLTFAPLVALRLSGVLRKNITADLEVQINYKRPDSSPLVTGSWTITIPNGTAIDENIDEWISGDLRDGDILTADVITSDGQPTDNNGIASFRIGYVVA